MTKVTTALENTDKGPLPPKGRADAGSDGDWHDDDAFWEHFAPVLFGPGAWERAATEAEQALAHLGVTPGARVLDLACGPGRHSLALARLGYRVTAVDRTASYLEELRRRAAAESLEIEIIHADMRSFERPETYDAAINLFTSFGYFDESGNNTVLDNLYSSLVAGGRVVFETVGKEILAAIFNPRTWSEVEPGRFLLEERKILDGWGRIRNRWLLIEDGEVFETTFDHAIFSAVELAALLRDVGFEDVAIYGDLEGAPYDHEARRLVAVATK